MAGATGKAEAMPPTLQIIAQQQRAMSSALLAVRTIAQVLASVFDPLAVSKSPGGCEMALKQLVGRRP